MSCVLLIWSKNAQTVLDKKQKKNLKPSADLEKLNLTCKSKF